MEYVHTGPLACLWAVLLFCAVLAAGERFGRLVLGRLGADAVLSDLEASVFSAGIGLCALSLSVLALGLTGHLSTITAALLVAVLGIVPSFLLRGAGIPELRIDTRPAAIAAAVMLFLSAAPAFAPPTGNDALAYHLAHPKAFIEQGRIAALPFTRESLWPFQTEMLFTLGLLLQGAALAQLLHWVFLPLTGAAVYACALRLYDRRVARVACGVWLFTPVVIAQAGHAYVDLALAFTVFAAFQAWLLRTEIGERSGAVLSGLFCGAALGTKYLALAPVAGLAALWFFRPLFLGTAAFVGGVWYLRSWLELGNPFYPFLARWFGGRGFDSSVEGFAPMGTGLAALLSHPWNVTMRPEIFGGEILGPVYLMFLPLLAVRLVRVKEAGLRQTTAFALFCYAALLFQSQHARYLILALPFLCVGIGCVIVHVVPPRGVLRGVTTAALLAVFIGHLGIAAYRSRAAWPVIAGTVTAADYLARHERSFKGYRYLAEHAQAEDRLLNLGEVRRFYDSRTDSVLWTEPLRLELEKKGVSLDDFIRRERFAYVWTRDGVFPGLDGSLGGYGYKEVFAYSFHEGAAAFRMRLYSLSS